MSLYEESLRYHEQGRPGKIEVIPTKPTATVHDLACAYSPGVAEPCRRIAEDPLESYRYTARGNLVAVVSNGTAVLGLGSIGPHAAKPVMEGKGMLFKKFADIDVFDLEIQAPDPADVIRFCKLLEPTVGAINLEDIKAPECFEIEETLRKELKIPVFHDDQHGTAIISGAAFLNAVELVGKSIKDVKCVFIGGGAACIACARMFLALGVQEEHLIMTDLDGVIYEGRTQGMNSYKQKFARKTPLRSLAEAVKGADVLVGLSASKVVTQEMVQSMASNPIIFAMANPEPEILPEEVFAVRPDAIMATGRSDYPNQVNNVLGYPYIFRGALDTRATKINEEMKMAAVKALAKLAKESVPENVSRAYGGEQFSFGSNYLIPKPFDPRALLYVAPAVAEAAMNSGVAQKKLDLWEYKASLEARLGSSFSVIRALKDRVRRAQIENKNKLDSIVFPEGDHPKILKACAQIREESIAHPVLLGNKQEILSAIEKLGLSYLLKDVSIVDPFQSEQLASYTQEYALMRSRKGVTLKLAQEVIVNRNYFGSMMLEKGHVQGLLSGVSQSYPETIKPALQIIGVEKGRKLAGIYMIILKNRVVFFADTTVNIEPSAESLADIAIMTANLSKQFLQEAPRVAMLSFSNFGSNQHSLARKVAAAVALAKAKAPTLMIDGEMQADTALTPEILQNEYSFSSLKQDANVLIFPDLQSGNIAYKLMMTLGGAETVGPILVGMKKPVNVLQQNCSVEDVVRMATITALEIQQFRDRG